MNRTLLAAAAVALLGGTGPGCATGSPVVTAEQPHGETLVSGPAPFDCDRHRAQNRDDALASFFVDLRCRVTPIWTCPAFCQGRDQHFVSRVAAHVDRSGQLASSQTRTGSGDADYDELSLAALRAGAPFAAPPAQVLDGTGIVPMVIEFSCDCRK